MPLAVYGKHPARGDFIEAGLGNLRSGLEVWLDAGLTEMRHGLGEAWEQVWAAAPPLRFWVGEAIWGEPVAGVLMASTDKVGRRFPLVILGYGRDCPPAPVIAPDQTWHDAVETQLLALLIEPAPETPAAILDGLRLPAVRPSASEPAEFWAVRPGPESGALWSDVALTDHQRACRSRNYWWREGAKPGWAQVWAGEALPSGHVLAWFFRGYQQND